MSTHYNQIHLFEGNIGMGLNHQEDGLTLLRASGAFFLARNPEWIRAMENIRQYIEYIDKESPDIIFLTEICGEEQRGELENYFLQKGYNTHAIQAFELWNMDAESHRFLYNIMATRAKYEVNTISHAPVFRKEAGSIYKYMRLIDSLGVGKVFPTINIDKVKRLTQGILDGGGAHYSIDGMEIGLFHVHGDLSLDKVGDIIESLKLKGGNAILGGDINKTLASAQSYITNKDSGFMRVHSERTFPHYAVNSTGILSKTIQGMGNKYFLSHPDQFYLKGYKGILQIKPPSLTGLKSDHSMNHLYINT